MKKIKEVKVGTVFYDSLAKATLRVDEIKVRSASQNVVCRSLAEPATTIYRSEAYILTCYDALIDDTVQEIKKWNGKGAYLHEVDVACKFGEFMVRVLDQWCEVQSLHFHVVSLHDGKAFTLERSVKYWMNGFLKFDRFENVEWI